MYLFTRNIRAIRVYEIVYICINVYACAWRAGRLVDTRARQEASEASEASLVSSLAAVLTRGVQGFQACAR